MNISLLHCKEQVTQVTPSESKKLQIKKNRTCLLVEVGAEQHGWLRQ